VWYGFNLDGGVVVSEGLSALKEEDVRKLTSLIESLDSSAFDYLQLQVGDVKVVIGKGAVPMGAPGVAGHVAAVNAMPIGAGSTGAAAPVTNGYASTPTDDGRAGASLPSRAASSSTPSSSTQIPPSSKRAAGPSPAGTIDIKAQIMGMYYAQPEPGSPAFVTVGAEVKEDTTVCLIEVMKTFNAMTAGVKGVITEICADNAQLVEYGQVLFRVRPL
jgi:acetyl-CoA carboxylase biotin carboxyl carrier protein